MRGKATKPKALTTEYVETLEAPQKSGKQKIYWDSEVKGFGVLCSGKTNTRTYIAQRDLPDGRSRRVTIERVNLIGLEEARSQAEDMLRNIRRGHDPKAKDPREWTLGTALDNYIAENKKLRPGSIKSYRHAVDFHMADWKDKPLRSITREMVQKRYDKLGNRPATANATMRTLRIVWNYAAPDTPNPAKLKSWYEIDKRTRHVSMEELPTFHAALIELPNPIHRDYLRLLLFTGMRRSEAASLTWEMVDVAGRMIRLPTSSTKTGEKLDLPMSDLVLGIFREREKEGREKFVFPGDGKSGYFVEPRFPLNQVAAETGIHVSAHDLRRTFITVASETPGIPFTHLKALVNHSLGKHDITMGYVRPSVEGLRKSAQAIANRFRKLCRIA